MKNGLTVLAYRAADDERAVVVATNQASSPRFAAHLLVPVRQHDHTPIRYSTLGTASRLSAISSSGSSKSASSPF